MKDSCAEQRHGKCRAGDREQIAAVAEQRRAAVAKPCDADRHTGEHEKNPPVRSDPLCGIQRLSKKRRAPKHHGGNRCPHGVCDADGNDALRQIQHIGQRFCCGRKQCKKGKQRPLPVATLIRSALKQKRTEQEQQDAAQLPNAERRMKQPYRNTERAANMQIGNRYDAIDVPVDQRSGQTKPNHALQGARQHQIQQHLVPDL